MKKLKLYGGAIEVQVPEEFEDASRFRQVPDFQEVYLHSTDNISIIFELLEKTNLDLKQTILQHYEILYNQSLNEQVIQVEINLQKNFGIIKIDLVLMGLKRFDQSDFLITVNGEFSKISFLNLMNSISLKNENLFK